MERRTYMVSSSQQPQQHQQNGSSSTMTSSQQQQQYRVTNSFIPTTTSHHGHHSHHHHPQQHHHQQTTHSSTSHHHHHPNSSSNNTMSKQIPNYYGTTGPANNSAQASHRTVDQPTYNTSNYHLPQQQQRTLTKSYSTSHSQSHYGITGQTNLGGPVNSNVSHHGHHQNTYYGNMTQSSTAPAQPIMVNGHANVHNNSNHHPILTYKNSNGEPIAANSRPQQAPVHHHHSQQYAVPPPTRQAEHHAPPPPPPQQNVYGMHTQMPSYLPQQQLTNGHHAQFNGNSSQHTAAMLAQTYASSETDGLPMTLVESMRTLFDILDDNKQGKIRLSDIESRWEIDSNGQPTNSTGKSSGAEPLIKMGVLGYLRKVTPADGMLTFDRFCAGLRLALLTNNENDEGGFLPSSMAAFHSHHPPTNLQQQQIGLPTIPPPPQQHQFQGQPTQTFQQQVRSLASKSSLPVQNPPANPNTPSSPQSNSNSMQRSSKIPGLSSSRLPMPSSNGSSSTSSSSIPTSPSSRIAAFSPTTQRSNPQGTSSSSSNATSSAETSPGNNPTSYPTKSALKNSISSPSTASSGAEQGTTIALVHQQPPPNPKPGSSGIPSSAGGTLKMTKQISAPGLYRYQSKNNSMDDLNGGFVPNGNSNHGHHQHTHHSHRPPSAPLLDNDDENIEAHQQPAIQQQHYVQQRQDTYSTGRKYHHHHHRERAKSQDRERVDHQKDDANNNNTSANNGGSKKVSIVTPRHRTLSMPQLQLNKLIKSKSTSAVVNFDESGGPPTDKLNASATAAPGQEIQQSNGHHHGHSRIGTLKSSTLNGSSSTSKLSNGQASKNSSSSSLLKYVHNGNNVSNNPNISKNDMNSSLPLNTSSSSSSIDAVKGDKDQPPPPPKPPRNGSNSGPVNGPVTISTTLVTNAVIHQEPPLSGSSQGSGHTQTTASTMTISSAGGSTGTGGGGKLSEIRNALQSWQKGILSTDKKPVEQTLSSVSVATNSSINTNVTTKSGGAPPPPPPTLPNENSNSNGKNNSEVTSGQQNGNQIVAVNNAKNTAANLNNTTTGTEVKLRGGGKSNAKRRETPRRHTVQTGIDFATLKRLKQLEQERDVLQQGMTFLEKAQQWFVKQLETADDRIALLSKGAPITDYWSESHEERLNLLGCRVSEVNSLLSALMDGSSQLPVHMNLQIPSHLSLRTITRLKDQNRQLTQEVSDCSHRITQLETEKAMLLRQLFHQKNSAQSDETVYM